MPWVPRGLREGIVTTRYPRRPDGYGATFPVAVAVRRGRPGDHRVAAAADACPTEAIAVDDDGPRLDRGRCILCGRCVTLAPGTFAFDPAVETAGVARNALVVPHLEESDQAIERTRDALHRRVRALRRSVHLRHVDAGSDGSEEWEIAALTGPIYDVHRLGIFFTASPRHADLLLVTGVGTAGMAESLRTTYEAMPDPRVVIAAGVDAISGGLIGSGYVTGGGVTDVVPVDVLVPGSPPSPFSLLHAILLAIGFLPGRGTAGREASPPSHLHGRAPHEPAPAEDPRSGAGS